MSLITIAAVFVATTSAAPLMGWNSYDDSGTSEAFALDAARFMASTLKPYGWDTVVVDGGWSDRIDGFGRQVSDFELFVDAAAATRAHTCTRSLRPCRLRAPVYSLTV